MALDLLYFLDQLAGHFLPVFCQPSDCKGVKNERTIRGVRSVPWWYDLSWTRLAGIGPAAQRNSPEKFQCHLRRGVLDLDRLGTATRGRAFVPRKRAFSAKKASIGPSATAGSRFV